MIVLPERSDLREVVAEIIAEVCRCDKKSLLEDAPFESIVEHYDSLAMLEILLGIEARYNVTTDDLLPSDIRSKDEMLAVFPKNLSDLVNHIYTVVDDLNKKEEERESVLEIKE